MFIFFSRIRDACDVAPCRQGAHDQCRNVYGLKKNHRAQPKKREPPPSDCSGLVLKGGAERSFFSAHYTQTATKNRRTQTKLTHSQKKRNNPQKRLTLRSSSETSACRSHSFFIYSHHIPFLHCHSPSTVRERLLFAVTVDSPSTQSSHSSAREPS